MDLMGVIRGIFATISGRIAAMRRLSRFTCGDCEFSDRCDLPPSENCVLRQDQIARGDWKVRRQAKAFMQDSRWVQ